MNKKSQLTFYIILGILIIVLVTMIYTTISKRNNLEFKEQVKEYSTVAEMRVDIDSYIKTCIKDAMQKSLEDTGIREDTIFQYQNLVENEVLECTSALFSILEEQGKDVETNKLMVNIDINEETIIVLLNYPIAIIQNNQKTNFENFEVTFDRTLHYDIPNGIVEEDMIIFSANKKAELRLSKGVKITDKNGNPIETISIKVLDKYFDNLINSVVMGNLVYDGLPDGAQFSEAVELAIEFRDEDIPKKYTRSNIRVAQWDREFDLWIGEPTRIEGNKAIAKIYHFTPGANVFVEPIVIRPRTFNQYLIKPIYMLCNDDGTDCECPTEDEFVVSGDMLLPTTPFGESLPNKEGKKLFKTSDESGYTPEKITQMYELKEKAIYSANDNNWMETTYSNIKEQATVISKRVELIYGYPDFDCKQELDINNHPKIKTILNLDEKCDSVYNRIEIDLDSDPFSKCIGQYYGSHISENDCYCYPVQDTSSCICEASLYSNNEMQGIKDYMCNSAKIEGVNDLLDSNPNNDYGAQYIIFKPQGMGVIVERNVKIEPIGLSAQCNIIGGVQRFSISEEQSEKNPIKIRMQRTYMIMGMTGRNVIDDKIIGRHGRNVYVKDYTSDGLLTLSDNVLMEACVLCSPQWTIYAAGLDNKIVEFLGKLPIPDKWENVESVSNENTN